jgi:tRNA U34 5-methylaminomethyl-2-thiouridine-forming methyltransferase MnmC
MTDLQVVLTEDGSHSLFNKRLNEHYHSTHGAIQESRHVFIEAGLHMAALGKQEIHILEVGFGTGLNCLMTLLECERLSLKVIYQALEPFPLSPDLVARFNYLNELNALNYAAAFSRMHSQSIGACQPGAQFQLSRSTLGLHDFVPEQVFDLVYFDAFAPDVQPELWTTGAFKKIVDCLAPGALLVTYCAKGQVRRNMVEVGFQVEKIPGPPGKREMTRASKPH